MSGSEELQQAINMLLRGDRDGAAHKLWYLESIITDKKMRVQLIDALLSASNLVDDCERLLGLNQEAIDIAKELSKPFVAHLMLIRISLLLAKLLIPQYERSNLKLSSDWFEFSTASDKLAYEKLGDVIKKIETEIDHLFFDVIAIAKEKKSSDILASAFLARGKMISGRLLVFKSECMRRGWSMKLWIKFNFFRCPWFNFLTVRGFKNRRKIRNMTVVFFKDILHAAKIFEELKDTNAGYAYYTLANELNTMYRFLAASKYLKRAEIIAAKNNDALLLGQINILRSRIKEKNRNIPNYIEGGRGAAN